MKKFLSAVLVCLLLVGSVFALAACGDEKNNKLSGTYEGHGLTLIFSGDNVTVEIIDMAVRCRLNGEYEIKDKKGKLAIEFSFDDADEESEDGYTEEQLKVIDKLESLDTDFFTLQPFEKSGSSIKIGVLTFTKK